MTAVARRTGILGGTFDPIHWGHLDVAAAAVNELKLSRLFIITSNVPPHRPQPLASSFHRFAMVSLALLDRPNTWRAVDVELRHEAPSFTSHTLELFHARGYLPSDLFFVIGADAFLEIASWHDYPRILDAAHFVVVSRPGSSVKELPLRLPTLADRMARPPLDEGRSDPLIILLDAPTADVSSTAVRQRLADRETITGLVPPPVQQHIEHHGLYSSITPDRRGSGVTQTWTAGRLHDKK
jgi:nicotinate-nucleotide adenylyltransferase